MYIHSYEIYFYYHYKYINPSQAQTNFSSNISHLLKVQGMYFLSLKLLSLIQLKNVAKSDKTSLVYHSASGLGQNQKTNVSQPVNGPNEFLLLPVKGCLFAASRLLPIQWLSACGQLRNECNFHFDQKCTYV